MRRGHAQTEYKNYNTFRIFGHYYNDHGNHDFSELDKPESVQNRHYGFKLIIFLMILIVAGLGLPPVLSYALKTPYPLVVITENSMSPILAENDLVLVKGLINKYDISKDDIIIYNNYANGVIEDSLTFKRVTAAGPDELMVRPEDGSSLPQKISYDQVIGKAVGDGNPFRIKWIGALAKIINSMNLLF